MFKKLLPVIMLVFVTACANMEGSSGSGMNMQCPCCEKCEGCKSSGCQGCKDGQCSCCKSGMCNMCQGKMSSMKKGEQCQMGGQMGAKTQKGSKAKMGNMNDMSGMK